jgi:hypothetical protein
MNTVEKYLANEKLNLKSTDVQRELYTNISEGLAKTGPESSLACEALGKYINEENQEPKFEGFAEGTPAKNLAYEIRQQNILPSPESANTYQQLFKEELPGLGKRSESEIQSFEQNLAYEASGFQRGYPPNSQEKMGLEIVEGKEGKNPSLLGQVKDALNPQTMKNNLMESLYGGSKAMAGILKGDKAMYAEGMLECQPLGLLNQAYQTQKKLMGKAAETLLGKQTFQELGLHINPLKTMEKGMEEASQFINSPRDYAYNLKDRAKNGELGRTAEMLTNPDKQREFLGDIKDTITNPEKATQKMKENLQEVIQNSWVVKMGKELADPKNQEKLLDARDRVIGMLLPFTNKEKNIEMMLGPSNSKKEKDGPEEETHEQTLKATDSIKTSIKTPLKETPEEEPNQEKTKKEEEMPYVEKFLANLSSRIAFDKAMKLGASPKQAGEMSQVAQKETQEMTQGLGQTAEKKGNELAKGAKNFATNMLSKAVSTAVPPPAGLALGIGIQIASSLAAALGDQKNQSDPNKQGPAEQGKSSPIQGLAQAIPGDLSAASAGPKGLVISAAVKRAKGALAKSFPTGLGKLGEQAGSAIGNEVSKKPEVPEATRIADRPI